MITDQVAKYFKQKQQQYKIFFAELKIVIQNLARQCSLSIDNQYTRIINLCNKQPNSLSIISKIQQLKAHRSLQFKGIVDLLVLALRQIPENVVRKHVPSHRFVYTNVQSKILQQNTPIVKFQSALPTNKAVSIPNNFESIKIQGRQQQIPKIIHKTILENKGNLKDTKINHSMQSPASKDKLNQTALSPNSKNSTLHPVNKLSPKVFELPKSIPKKQSREAARQQSLGIIDGNKNSLIKVIELFKDNQVETNQTINFKICQQLDRKIYRQANQYLQDCKNREINKRISSPIKRLSRNIRADSSITKLAITQTKKYEPDAVLQKTNSQPNCFSYEIQQ